MFKNTSTSNFHADIKYIRSYLSMIYITTYHFVTKILNNTVKVSGLSSIRCNVTFPSSIEIWIRYGPIVIVIWNVFIDTYKMKVAKIKCSFRAMESTNKTHLYSLILQTSINHILKDLLVTKLPR